MPIELKITAENTREFDVLMARFAPSAVTTCEPEARGPVAVEAEATLDPAPKQTRQRKAKMNRPQKLLSWQSRKRLKSTPCLPRAPWPKS